MPKSIPTCLLLLTSMVLSCGAVNSAHQPEEVPPASVAAPMSGGPQSLGTVSAGFAVLEAEPGAMTGAPPAVADKQTSTPASDLMSRIVIWLAAEFGLPATHAHPRIELISPQAMARIRYPGLVASRRQTNPNGPDQVLSSEIGRDLVALYHDASRTIYLLEGSKAESPVEQSVVVHEMVHHLQNVAGLKYPCPQARETPAYAAQQKWLARYGLDFFKEFETNPMTLLLRTACGF